MAITDEIIIQKYIDEYQISFPDEQNISSIFVYETTSKDRNHYKKTYLTSKDIQYYGNENKGIKVAIFTEDPELLDADNVYTEVTE